MHLALNKATNDLYKPEGGGVTRVTEGRFVVQQVQCKLKTLLGEWLLDTSIGWVNLTDFERNFSISELEDRARVIILGTQGVLKINSMYSVYENRELIIYFTADTIYGEISLEVPWDNANQPI